MTDTVTNGRRPVVAMLMYPNFTHLDLVGPHAAFSAAMDVHLVWKTLDPVRSDSGMQVLPTTTLTECPRDVDLLFVPGGLGTAAAMADLEVLQFLNELGHRARLITSVCTGSLVLGAAGLLQGYRAGTHWAFRELLPLFGAENVSERVVVDRNRITGGGVTAGLDFGLSVLAELLGEDVARTTQLALEYDPAPPFDSGSPERAAAGYVAAVRAMVQPMNDEVSRVATEIEQQGWARRHAAPATA